MDGNSKEIGLENPFSKITILLYLLFIVLFEKPKYTKDFLNEPAQYNKNDNSISARL